MRNLRLNLIYLSLFVQYICMGSPEHIVSLSYRTDRWVFMKLGKDEVLMALHMR